MQTKIPRAGALTATNIPRAHWTFIRATSSPFALRYFASASCGGRELGPGKGSTEEMRGMGESGSGGTSGTLGRWIEERRHARILFTNGTEEQVSCGGLQVVGVGGPRSSLAARASLDVRVEHREAVALLLLVLVPAFMVVGAVAAVDAAIDEDTRRAFGSSGTGWYRHS
ncbi:hypothetical protein C8J57DRAFT_1475473 [Mycena rebaudengoi]|nr:hypothetical protein C8J57DRAFT_1475473 [Mycena rebaudengoi]